MDFLKKYDLTPGKMLKASAVLVVGVFLLMFVVSFVKNSYGGPRFSMMNGSPVMSFAVAPASYDDYGGGDASYSSGAMMKLSTRNVVSEVMPVPQYPGTPGNTAEDFEVKDYNASIETQNKVETCGKILGLKPLAYVIFENVNESDTYCNTTFKVESSHVSEIVAIIKGLNPKDFSEGIYTIKSQIDDYTNEIEILQKKRASIDDTLKNALTAYDSIASLATKALDAATLAKVIDSKIQTIERLTQERININSMLDQMTRSKAEQLDRLKYTYFHVNVYENKYIDGKSIKDSWKQSVRDMVNSVNRALQNATVNLIGFLVGLISFIIYALVILFIAKYGWNLVKIIWKK